MDYKEQLETAVCYAQENGSFSKINLAETAEIVCAYGLGRFFNEAFRQWDFKNKMHVSVLCDRDENRWGRVYDGLRCISPKELFELSQMKRVLVIPFIGNSTELNRELKEKKIDFVNASDCIFEIIANMERSRGWFSKNNILEVLGWLADDESRRVYTNALCNRIAPYLSQFDYDDLYSEGEYFATSAFGMDENECYVDCGAYNGDTIERMLSITEGQASHIYAFEMDKGNYIDLKQKIGVLMERYQISLDIFSLYNVGVWNCNERLPYGKEIYGSRESCSLLKKDIIDFTWLVKLDDILTSKKVSMIKMDIEGAEYRALNGAKNIILRNRPKMAICLYHRLQDFWKVPTYIKSLVPEYKIYVRHHQKGAIVGTVMYAVIECR